MSQIQAAATLDGVENLTTRVSRVPALLMAGVFALAAYTAGNLIQLDIGPSLGERNARAHAALERLGVEAPNAVLVQ